MCRSDAHSDARSIPRFCCGARRLASVVLRPFLPSTAFPPCAVTCLSELLCDVSPPLASPSPANPACTVTAHGPFRLLAPDALSQSSDPIPGPGRPTTIHIKPRTLRSSVPDTIYPEHARGKLLHPPSAATPPLCVCTTLGPALDTHRRREPPSTLPPAAPVPRSTYRMFQTAFSL